MISTAYAWTADPGDSLRGIAGIEAVQMIRKGQVLGITKKNLHGQAWVFGRVRKV